MSLASLLVFGLCYESYCTLTRGGWWPSDRRALHQPFLKGSPPQTLNKDGRPWPTDFHPPSLSPPLQYQEMEKRLTQLHKYNHWNRSKSYAIVSRPLRSPLWCKYILELSTFKEGPSLVVVKWTVMLWSQMLSVVRLSLWFPWSMTTDYALSCWIIC